MATSQPDLLVDPDLLDVVPWSYGFAHSWALGALLSDDRTSHAILAALPGLPRRSQWRMDGSVHRERGLKPARADLAFTVKDASGAQHQVAVETKVNDPFRPEQMAAYRAAEHTPVLFLPGLTGLLLEPTPPTSAAELRLFGRTLIAAVDRLGLQFGPVIGGYLAALKQETRRMETACAAARGERRQVTGPGRSRAADLEAVAWLAETFRALPDACAGTAIPPDAAVRVEANDRGIFFAGSFTRVADEGGLWVDVIADVRSHARAVAIKAGEQGIERAWDRAAEAGAPGAEWRRAARRVSRGTATVWKRSLDHADARAAAAEAVRAAEFIRALA